MRWRLALVTTLCLCAAAPPVWFPGAGLLVVAGWAGFYALVTGPAARRPRLTAYLVGLAHMLFFSFSVRHVLLAGYLGIGLVGGLYYLLTAVWTRALGRWLPGALAFGCAVAGGCWLRAHFVEIQYPHVQPAHSLYHWPALLGGLRWGGEELVNLLLAGLAAALVDAYRGWRLGRPAFRRARAVLCGVVVLWGLGLIDPGPAPTPGSRSVRLVLIEPRFPPIEHREAYVRLMRSRVIEPTLAVVNVVYLSAFVQVDEMALVDAGRGGIDDDEHLRGEVFALAVEDDARDMDRLGVLRMVLHVEVQRGQSVLTVDDQDTVDNASLDELESALKAGQQACEF